MIGKTTFMQIFLMRYSNAFFIVVCALIAESANAQQQSEKITFNQDGKAISASDGAVSMPKIEKRTTPGLFRGGKTVIFEFPVANSSPVKDYTLTAKQKTALRKELAAKFQKAIDNMQDETLHLKDIYDLIWGDGETDKIIQDYKAFVAFLADETGQPSTHDTQVTHGYTPKPSTFASMVLGATIYKEEDNNSGKEYLQRKLIYVDPYKHFILDYLESTMNNRTTGISTQQMDLAYKKAWRGLENVYKEGEKALVEIKEALKPCNPTASKDYKELIKQLKELISNKSNPVQKLLQKDFFKQWLWYNEGYLFMNPVLGTTKDRRYPAGEKVSQLTDENRKFLVADSAADKMLAELLTARRVKNEVLIAKQNNHNPDRMADRYYYDAAVNYECLNKKDLPKARDAKRGIDLVVYNVPLKDKLSFNLDKSKDIADMGSVAQSIADAGSGPLSLITSNATDWIKAWGKVSETFDKKRAVPVYNGAVLNAGDLAVAISPIGATVTEATIRRTSRTRDYNTFSMASRQMAESRGITDAADSVPRFGQEYLYELFPRESDVRKYLVKIGDRTYAASNNSDTDKVVFTKAFLIEADKTLCNECNYWVENCLIDTFLLRDRCYALDYKNQKVLQDGVNALIKRFACYITDIRECRLALKKDFDEINENYLPAIRAYLSIIQRSLPPVLTRTANDIAEEDISKDTTEYRTELLGITKGDLPDSPKKIVYRVISNQPVKQVDGKKTGEQNVVIEHSYRYSNKRHFIDFSVGIAGITTDYTVKTLDGSLPKVSEGERFRPIAGMHIYPGGLLKIDDRLRPQLSRFSFFLGVSLSKALENFYPAVSYDAVPGIRIMGGYHFYKDTRYTIVNNQVIDRASSYRGSGLFIALNMEPKSFVTFIGLLK